MLSFELNLYRYDAYYYDDPKSALRDVAAFVGSKTVGLDQRNITAAETETPGDDAADPAVIGVVTVGLATLFTTSLCSQNTVHLMTAGIVHATNLPPGSDNPGQSTFN